MNRFLHNTTVSELIRSAQQGDREAFNTLFDSFYDAIFHFVFIRLQNYQDAEDVTQEIFVKAWLSINKYKDQGIPFNHYLFRVAHNAIVDHHRRNKRLVFVEDVDFNRADDALEEEMRLQLDMHNLSLFLDRLPADYQKVLTLRYMRGLTPEETAQVMRRTPVATRILQHRALVAARDLVHKDEDC